jgi:hypothetical protein
MKYATLALMTASVLSLCGCATNRDARIVNTDQPGPAIGTAVGTVGGAVAGNAAGLVVGVGEGAANAAAMSFDNDRRVVRTWRTEVTADGRTIQVPVEFEVDKEGRPLK